MTAGLVQELSTLKQGAHICMFYESATEQLAVAVSFIIDGLARGERCVYTIDDRTIEEVAQALRAAGVDVERERQRDALRLLTRNDTYLRTAEFVPKAMIDFIRHAEAEALADGFSGLRLTGETTWVVLPEAGWDRFIEYEALVNDFATIGKSVVLCQYNRSRLDATCIHDVFRTHPLAILGESVCRNPHYELPEMIVGHGQITKSELAEKRVDWWISQLKQARADEQARELAMEKLKQSERRLAEAQRVAHIGSWERDLRSDEVIWSDELYRLFGREDGSTLSYQRFLDLVQPDDVDRIRALVEEAIRLRKSFNCDYRITLADGSVRILNDRGNVILSEAGEPIRLVGTAQDVTELRQAEQAQQELEKQKFILQTIFDHIPVMISFVDADARMQMVNRHWERVLGWSMEEAQGRDLTPETFPDPDSRARVMEYVRHPSPGWTDFKTRARDGRTLDTSWFPIVLPDGTRIGIGQDITERKQAGEALRLSEERLNLAVHAADLGIFEHDHRTDTLYWSPTMRAIFGWEEEETASLPAYLELIHPEDRERIAAAVDQAHAPSSSGLYRVEHRVIRHDGGIRWVSVSSRTLFEGEGDARRPLRTVGIVADVTDRKGSEKKIREYSESVQALSRRLLEVHEEERRHLARELHDEFGQILTAIILYVQAARGVAGEAARPQLDQCASLLELAMKQVSSLAGELRPPMLDDLGLEATLRWLAAQHQQRTGSEVQVVSHLSSAPPSPEIAIACFRVAQEALTNVARHADARLVWIELRQSESVLTLIVRDNGVGFDVAPTQEKAVRRGRLGLMGMVERVKLLGGSLQVESKPGQGTRVCASFPSR